MKIPVIFLKNLRTISRNWKYFLVLFIFPIILILAAGFMLNSTDVKNMKIGVVNEDPTYTLNIENIHSWKNYPSLTDCINSILNSEIVVCMHIKDMNDSRKIDIYIDNSFRLVEYYTKQFILENVVKEQSSILDQTSEEINSKLTLYSTSISSARDDLVQVRKDLNDQEYTLTEYKKNLSETRKDFDSFYNELKNLQPQITQMRTELMDNQQNIKNNVTYLQSKEQDINSRINIIKNTLSGRVDAQTYDIVVQNLDSITVSLNEIEIILNQVETTQQNSQQILAVFNNVDQMMSKLDSIRQTLDQIDNDLDASILKTRNSKAKVDVFLLKLDDATREISAFSSSKGSKRSVTEFKRAFSIKDDLVFLSYPLLIAIIITFTSLILSNMFIIREINKPSYFRDIISPTRDISFILADYFINVFFVAIQAIVLFLIGFYWFNVSISIAPIFFISIFLAASIFILMGMAIGYIVKSESLSMLFTIFLVMLFIIFSDILSPSVLATPVLNFFINMNPFVILQKVLTDIIIINRPILGMIPNLIKLGVFMIVLFVITYIAKKISKENIMQ